MGERRGESVAVVVNILAAPIRTAATAMTLAACLRVELLSVNKESRKKIALGAGCVVDKIVVQRN